MPELSFRVDDVTAVSHAAEPLLAFRLSVINAVGDEQIHSVLLRCQIQIDATRRRYDQPEQEHLLDLFGEPSRWDRTLRSLLWTNTNVSVPGFIGQTTVDLQVPCSYDFNVAATKYFYALENGVVPLSFLFSGTVFYAAGEAPLQIAQIPWDREASFRLPVSVWQQLNEMYYPNCAWLSLQRETFDRLYRYKLHNGMTTWEQALETLLTAAEEAVRT